MIMSSSLVHFRRQEAFQFALKRAVQYLHGSRHGQDVELRGWIYNQKMCLPLLGPGVILLGRCLQYHLTMRKHPNNCLLFAPLLANSLNRPAEVHYLVSERGLRSGSALPMIALQKVERHWKAMSKLERAFLVALKLFRFNRLSR